MSDEPPRILRIFETVVYAADLPAAARFYEALGLRRVAGLPDALGVSFRLPDGGVLLVFDPELAREEGRPVPPHGAAGTGHVALSVEPGTLDAAAAALARAGIAVEQHVTWRAGGRSLYVRDPAGNSVELIDGDPWPS